MCIQSPYATLNKPSFHGVELILRTGNDDNIVQNKEQLTSALFRMLAPMSWSVSSIQHPPSSEHTAYAYFKGNCSIPTAAIFSMLPPFLFYSCSSIKLTTCCILLIFLHISIKMYGSELPTIKKDTKKENILPHWERWIIRSISTGQCS